MQMWYRLQAILYPWYEQIQREALRSAVLHADESGWRVDGKTHWLWCFTTKNLTFYMIDRSRGSPALKKFFIEEFAGTLVTDFWGAYNGVACALRQTCLVHLLRELEHTEKYKSPGKHWPAFAKKLRRLVGDAIRLWRRRDELPAAAYDSRRARLLTIMLAPLVPCEARLAVVVFMAPIFFGGAAALVALGLVVTSLVVLVLLGILGFVALGTLFSAVSTRSNSIWGADP